MQRSIVSVASILLCSCWMTAAAQPARAQEQQPAQQPPTQESAPAANVSDQKLDQTAAAIKNVQVLRKNYAEKMSAAKPDEQDQIATEASTAMQKAVTDQGLSVEEYNSIVQLAQDDPGVREQIVKRLRAEGNEGK
jgi:Domain of unknown function (DUF4168)